MTGGDPLVALRPYRREDEAAAIALWQRAWQSAYPAIDFAGRLGWWQARWRNEMVPLMAITLAEAPGGLLGFAAVDLVRGYLDQIVVAPEAWGSGVASRLLDEAFRQSPGGLALDVNADNLRALRFYEKRGFVRTGTGTNPLSGRPTILMHVRPTASPQPVPGRP